MADEFPLRRLTNPDLKRAELINGTVYLPSPVSLGHQECQSFLNGWLDHYASSIPGCRPALEGTWLMG